MHQIELTRAAVKQLRRLDAVTKKRIDEAISALANDPHPPGSVKLEGCENTWRIRIGSYRAV